MRAKRAFTLIETMVAMAILSVLMLALLGLAATSRHTSRQAENRLAADTIAQNLLEEARHRGFSALEPTTVELLEVDSEWGLPGATARQVVEKVPGYGGHLIEVEITVTWPERGRERTSTRSLLVSSLGD